MPLVTAPHQESPVELFMTRDMGGTRLRVWSDPGFVRVRSGVYARRSDWAMLRPWERYLARVHAYSLVSPGTIFSHESAAALLGLPVFGEPRQLHVFDPARRASMRFGDVAVHTGRESRAVVSSGALLTTNFAHTALDLARVLPPAFALAVVDKSLEECNIDQLAQLAASQSSARGRALLRWLHAHADPRSESVGESVSRAVIHWLGFEAPDSQVEVRSEGFLDRVDFAWKGPRVIGESDGYGKYQSDDPEVTKAGLIAEKVREDRLRRTSASSAHWDWASAMQASPLGDRLHRAGVEQTNRPQPAMLATLHTNPRSFGSDEPLGATLTRARAPQGRPWQRQ